MIRKIDEYEGMIVLMDETRIPLDDVIEKMCIRDRPISRWCS